MNDSEWLGLSINAAVIGSPSGSKSLSSTFPLTRSPMWVSEKSGNASGAGILFCALTIICATLPASSSIRFVRLSTCTCPSSPSAKGSAASGPQLTKPHTSISIVASDVPWLVDLAMATRSPFIVASPEPVSLVPAEIPI